MENKSIIRSKTTFACWADRFSGSVLFNSLSRLPMAWTFVCCWPWKYASVSFFQRIIIIYIYILKHQWRMDRMIVDAHPNLQFSKSFYHRSKMRCLEGEITPYMSDFGSFNMKVPDCPYRLNPEWIPWLVFTLPLKQRSCQYLCSVCLCASVCVCQ